MLLLTNIFLIIGGTCSFFIVKQATHLLFYKNSAVTDGTEVDWDDIHKFLHFIDRREVFVCHCCTR